jgi:hypothetical protein
MRAAASSLTKLARLRRPAAQVGVMLLPPPCTLDEWEARAIAHQTALMAACARDRGDDDNGLASSSSTGAATPATL